MTRIGLRRHLRGALAAGLAGTAAALTAAAGLVETIAQELRLTLPDAPRDRDAGAADERGADVGAVTEVIAPEPAPDLDEPGMVDTSDVAAPDDVTFPDEAPPDVEPSFLEDAPLERAVFSETQPPRAVPGEPVPAPDEEFDAAGLPGDGPSVSGEASVPPEDVPPGIGPPETVLDDESSAIPPAPCAAPDAPEPWADDVAATVAGGTVREAVERLPELSATQLRALERYERGNRGRVTLLRAIDAELALRG